MRILNSKRGAVLMMSFLIIVVVTIYLASYVIWTIWDQKNLLRRQRLEEADKLARAGLNRAIVDLQLESDSWLDGEINGYNVTAGNVTNPDVFNALYNQSLASGNYSVELRYLYDSGTNSFLDKRMWVRSTGFTADAYRALEQMVDFSAVKNLDIDAGQGRLYANSQPAVNDAGTSNNRIAITAVTLRENVTIGNFTGNMSGCYDPTFSRRSCGNYYSLIQGKMNITGSANVTLSGVTIE